MGHPVSRLGYGGICGQDGGGDFDEVLVGKSRMEGCGVGLGSPLFVLVAKSVFGKEEAN
jgi:hypothetical protein